MRDDKYNGWSNYATWRVNLELFDSFNVEEFSGHPYDSSYRLALDIEDWAYDAAIGGHDGLVADYARAFMSQVNWCEIASHLLENQDRKEEISR